jgi:putative acetyltransferase
VQIRSETPQDAAAIAAIIRQAFAATEYGYSGEAELVERLRAMKGLALSMVAEDKGEILGHIAFSPAQVNGKAGSWYQLAPVSVRPDFRCQGIGSALIRAGINGLEGLGASACFVLGDPGYYTRFGFVSDPCLSDTAPAPNAFFMRLVIKGAAPIGKVTYHPAFD